MGKHSIDFLFNRMLSGARVTGNECIETTGRLTKSNCGHVWYNGKHYDHYRFAWIAVYGEPNPGEDVLHKCDNRKCFNLDHLYLGNDYLNQRDALLRDRKAKLKCENVKDIRILLASKITQTEIAKRFGVHQCQISRIANKKRWSLLK